ncbi:MAG: hypothetical protein NWT02_13165 [Opitutales bacterium]|jgi:hypothetical protein|nr:hypothetical protein [Opitutales bacterium]MDP4643740.1 hypothetical protein [Opitutales bacterium]MDP4777142.1 hypothetical protein [Opitutales bacterium]MDP4879690.1 hypothetical protein [Opitutales bacterium]MDP4883954.1 hypothetical protein [Opitutales bacterium]
MKVDYKIYKEHKLIVEVISGDITIEGLADKTNTLFSDPGYDVNYVGVADYRLAVSQITRAELYGFANFINKSDQFGKSKWAIIANDPMVVALSQVFQQRLLDQSKIGIFNSPIAASKFIEKPVLLDLLK